MVELRFQSTLSSKINTWKFFKCTKTNFSRYIYNLPFSGSSNIEKIRVNVGLTFPILWVLAPTELQFSISFFHWFVANQGTNKIVPAISFFSNIFWIIWFQLFSCKIQQCQIINNNNKKKINNWLLEKTWTWFCAAVCEKCVCKSLELIFSTSASNSL